MTPPERFNQTPLQFAFAEKRGKPRKMAININKETERAPQRSHAITKPTSN
jgi:hypothetical protein